MSVPTIMSERSSLRSHTNVPSVRFKHHTNITGFSSPSTTSDTDQKMSNIAFCSKSCKDEIAAVERFLLFSLTSSAPSSSLRTTETDPTGTFLFDPPNDENGNGSAHACRNNYWSAVPKCESYYNF